MTVKHLFPAVEPSLNLDFANSKKLDPRITFTRSSTGTYVDSNGVIKTAAANEARFDHDGATGSSLGLLVEESRTNLITYSEEFNNSFWTTVNSSVTVNSATSPDGTLTADKLVENTSNIYHQIATGNVTLANPSFSCYVKAAERNFVNLKLYYAGGGNRVWATFSLVDGSVTDQGKINTFFTNESVKSESLGNSWFRFTLSANTASAQSIIGTVELSNAAVPTRTNGSPVYTGDGTSGIYVWGAQLETGSFPTSYIPTSGSTVTRSADVASMTGTNFSSWYNQSEGTILVTAKTPDTARVIFEFSNNTNQQRILSSLGAGLDLYVVSNGAVEVSINNNPWSTNFANVGFGVAENNFTLISNGTVLGADTAGSMPDVITKLNLGSGYNSTVCTSHLSRLTYYPYRLTDAQLQALTL